MKYIILINLIIINMFGFTLSVNSGKDMGNDYYIAHLEDTSDIVCRKIPTKKVRLIYVKSVLR
ncbi:hypothetical protein [Campylobacter fetus]|uniref:DUF7494 domain-containing protein n=1 Tax=Campylobacter fetus TaxID=196 RepID=UPI001911BBB8|nr:hypothetical protein [Campylobacter fetus]